jgi:hypothetical protein
MADKFDKDLNMDVATPAKIAETNEELVEYMQGTGENVAAERIDYLIKNQTSEGKKTQADPNSFKLLTVNKKILSVLEKIYRDMFDEQDTSIKHTARDVSTSTSLTGRIGTGAGTDTDEDGFGFGDIPGTRGRRGRRARPVGTGKKDKDKKKKTSKNAKKTKGAPKPRPTSRVGKNLAKSVLRFGKLIPGIGLAIGGVMAAIDGVQGYENAAETLGIAESELTTANKASSAAGGVISGLTFGLADGDDAAKGINNLTGGNKSISKYEDLGIIDHDTIGDSEITSWNKLSKLSKKEIQEIIDIDDWSSDVLEKLKAIKSTARATPRTITRDESKVEKIDYNMKQVPPVPGRTSSTSLSPDDHKASDLFMFNDVKEDSFADLEPNTLSNLKAMAAEYFDTYGKKIQINSAFRSFEDQEKMKKKYGANAAAPGSSMHEYGLAVDMETKDANGAIKAGLFKKYGFNRPVPGETWHVEPKGIDRAGIREAGLLARKAETGKSSDSGTKSKQESGRTPQDVADATKIQSPTAVKIPTKTSELMDEVEVASKELEVPAEVNREYKESVIGKSTENLTRHTAMTEKGTDVAQMASIVAPLINKNINTIQQAPKDDRVLGVFSS